MSARADERARLHGRWLAVALTQLGLTVELAVGFRIATGLVLLLGSVALALLIFRQRSDDWLALLTALMTLSIGALFNGLSALTVVPPAWDALASFVRITAPLLFFVTTFLFPDGRWVPRGASVVATLSTVYVLSWVVFPDLPLNVYRLD